MLHAYYERFPKGRHANRSPRHREWAITGAYTSAYQKSARLQQTAHGKYRILIFRRPFLGGSCHYFVMKQQSDRAQPSRKLSCCSVSRQRSVDLEHQGEESAKVLRSGRPKKLHAPGLGSFPLEKHLIGEFRMGGCATANQFSSVKL